MQYRIEEYAESGKSPFGEWFDGLDPVTAARVDRYIRRLEAGNFGAAKALRGGICELASGFWAGLSGLLRTGREDAGHFAGRRR